MFEFSLLFLKEKEHKGGWAERGEDLGGVRRVEKHDQNISV